MTASLDESRSHRPSRGGSPRNSFEFGQTFRSSFFMPSAPQLAVRDLHFGPLGALEVRYDDSNYGDSDPMPAQDALLVSMQLRANPRYDIWEDDKRLTTPPFARGMSSIYDLRGGLRAHSRLPSHCVGFFLPMCALPEAGEEALLSDCLAPTARLGMADPVMAGLAQALLPALARPAEASRLFVDHVLFALRAHIAQLFTRRTERPRGGLALWQERRAKAMIEAHLHLDLSLPTLAQECGLSVAHFARAFKCSLGVPPYQFLLTRRIERARTLLATTPLSLADIAVACGFADQSHFTKTFRRIAGQSPGALRAERPRRRPR